VSADVDKKSAVFVRELKQNSIGVSNGKRVVVFHFARELVGFQRGVKRVLTE